MDGEDEERRRFLLVRSGGEDDAELVATAHGGEVVLYTVLESSAPLMMTDGPICVGPAEQ